MCVGAVLALLAVPLAVGCRSGGRDGGGLYSANPLDRAKAVVRAAERRDPEAVDKLVDLLNDDDAGVRMYASQALRRLCQRDFGYRHYHPEAVRLEAIERWRDALRRGEITVEAGAAGARAQAAASDAGGVP